MAQEIYDELTELVNDVKRLSERLVKLWNNIDYNLQVRKDYKQTTLICDSCKEEQDGV